MEDYNQLCVWPATIVGEEDKKEFIQTVDDVKVASPIDKWSDIIKLIDEKDKRISSSLENVKLKLDDGVVMIELADSSNSFIDKILNDNLSLI